MKKYIYIFSVAAFSHVFAEANERDECACLDEGTTRGSKRGGEGNIIRRERERGDVSLEVSGRGVKGVTVFSVRTRTHTRAHAPCLSRTSRSLFSSLSYFNCDLLLFLFVFLSNLSLVWLCCYFILFFVMLLFPGSVKLFLYLFLYMFC